MRPRDKRRAKSGNGVPPAAGSGVKNKSSIPERTAAWPSVPGRTQSRDRSNGIKRLKTSAKSEGC